MRDLLTLKSLSSEDIFDIFRIADSLCLGKYRNCLSGKSIVMFFPSNSIRTRVTFEKGIFLSGGQTILFPVDTLDKREEILDVFGYLNNWADAVIVRHKDMKVLENIAEYSSVPVINAMTDINHPCEILSDLYALWKKFGDFDRKNYLFCGKSGNIGLGWKEASEVLGFTLEQCCPDGCEMDGVKHYTNIYDAIKDKDIICTDSLPSSLVPGFESCRVTADALAHANPDAILNPCPPFYRGEEVSEDAVASDYFVGYDFKKHLLEVQQAIILWCMEY